MSVRTLLAVIALLASRTTFAFDCRHEVLSSEDKSRLATVVMRHTKIAANLATIEACKDLGSVFLETFRIPQNNGAQRWFQLSCSRMQAPWPEPWHCIEYPRYGFRADSYPGELGVWIETDQRGDLDAARRDVAQALVLLAGTGDVPGCEEVEGPKTVEGMRADFTQGDGFLAIGGTEYSFFLEHELVRLEFERSRDSRQVTRIKCWAPIEVLVTS